MLCKHKQVEAAIQSMEESTKAQRDNLATPQAQSENTLTVAKIRALAVQVSADTAEIRETDKQMEPVIFLDLKKERRRLVENPPTAVGYLRPSEDTKSICKAGESRRT